MDGVDERQALDEDPRERFGAFLGSRFLGRSSPPLGGLQEPGLDKFSPARTLDIAGYVQKIMAHAFVALADCRAYRFHASIT